MVMVVGAVSAVDIGDILGGFGGRCITDRGTKEMMEAVEFFEERDRMCDWFNGDCAGCEIFNSMKGLVCRAYIFQHPEEAVAIVERWSKAHPKKTR